MWTHTNPLFEGYELDTLDETVTFVPPAGTVNSYSVTSSPAQSVFTALAGASGIDVQTIGENLIGLFPFESAHYLEDYDNEVLVTSWDDIPQGKRMVDFVAHPSTSFTFVVTCVCNWTDTSVTPPVPRVDEIDLDVTIWHHYDIDRLAMLEKVSEEVITDASSS